MDRRKADYFDRGPEEEKWNYITHGIGAIFMLCYVINSQVPTGKVLSLFLAFTFLASACYHSAMDIEVKERLRKIDMASIYLSIGATASAFCHTVASPIWYAPLLVGLSLFIVSLLAYGEIWDKVMVSLSVLFASLSVVVFFQASYGQPEDFEASSYFYLGNVFYSAGLWFYVRDKSKYFHTIWHVFVLLGAVIHSSYYFTV